MPEFQEPAWNDSWTDLWRKQSQNWYQMAVSRGFTESLEPNALDNQKSAMRKVCIYTAFIATTL
jgi:hypothetical protein